MQSSFVSSERVRRPCVGRLPAWAAAVREVLKLGLAAGTTGPGLGDYGVLVVDLLTRPANSLVGPLLTPNQVETGQHPESGSAAES